MEEGIGEAVIAALIPGAVITLLVAILATVSKLSHEFLMKSSSHWMKKETGSASYPRCSVVEPLSQWPSLYLGMQFLLVSAPPTKHAPP